MAFNRIREYFSHPYEHPGEGKLVRKIDFFILTFCCLSYFTNYLDRSNLANAYVSGMKEELGFVGNQYNQINTVFTVGYVVGQVPSNLALYHLKPRIFFPSMMLIWGALTMVTAAVHHPRDIMAIRFFQGIAESSTFVGTHYILGSWYTARELGKRSGIFTSSGLAGTMFGGFLQTAIHSSLNGARGMSGWRWLFIIDGLITIPIAIYGLLLFPDTPTTTSAFYLSPAERALAISRVPEVPERRPFNFDFVKRVFSSWYWYGFVMLWIIAGETESFSSNSLLALYMKSTKRYSVAQLNNYPTGVPAVGIVSTLFWATLTDFLGGKRYLVGYWIGITGIVTAAMILNPHASTASHFGAYYWAGSVYACQATFFAWANDAMRWEEDSLRAVVIASMNCGSNAVNAWWSILFYSANFAPKFTKGMWAMIGTSIALVIWTSGLLYIAMKTEKKRIAEAQVEYGDEKNFESVPGGNVKV
ncbi:pantothenate transporter-like protein [Hyaloscypha hepaticicola]|uniref:Pantothenate transporter-like protein n=1 Tax=Hyaloscypha hepaticicola TaxID=2082293 RepID=A0A2J6PY47_9HELO|nr:pantothenate transporter-like protein [Hyaloscypha hepaticicola]